jgi:hypothetical protein
MPHRPHFALAVLGLTLASGPLLAGPSTHVVLVLGATGSSMAVRELLEDQDDGVHHEDTVRAPLDAPSSVVAGGELLVSWSGLDITGDLMRRNHR